MNLADRQNDYQTHLEYQRRARQLNAPHEHLALIETDTRHAHAKLETAWLNSIPAQTQTTP